MKSNVKAEEKIFGRHSVMEVILAGRRKIDAVFMAPGLRGATFREIQSAAEKIGIPVREVERKRLDQIAGTDTHQGVMALVAPLADEGLSGILARAMHAGEPPLILLADGVTDPHNLGAMIRTASLTGAHGVIIPEHGSAPLDRVTSKSSSGAVEHIPICRVGNLAAAIGILRNEGVRVLAADADPGALDLYSCDLSGPIAIVIGAEGKGVSRVVKERCAARVRIPMRGILVRSRLASLNASVAAAVILFEIMRRRLNEMGGSVTAS